MTKPESADPVFDVELMRDLVERSRGRLSHQDHACLSNAVEAMAELRTLVMDGDVDAHTDGVHNDPPERGPPGGQVVRRTQAHGGIACRAKVPRWEVRVLRRRRAETRAEPNPKEALGGHARARDTVGSAPPRIAMHRAR